MFSYRSTCPASHLGTEQHFVLQRGCQPGKINETFYCVVGFSIPFFLYYSNKTMNVCWSNKKKGDLKSKASITYRFLTRLAVRLEWLDGSVQWKDLLLICFCFYTRVLMRFYTLGEREKENTKNRANNIIKNQEKRVFYIPFRIRKHLCISFAFLLQHGFGGVCC